MVQVLPNLKKMGRLFCSSAKSGKNLKSRFPEQLFSADLVNILSLLSDERTNQTLFPFYD